MRPSVVSLRTASYIVGSKLERALSTPHVLIVTGQYIQVSVSSLGFSTYFYYNKLEFHGFLFFTFGQVFCLTWNNRNFQTTWDSIWYTLHPFLPELQNSVTLVGYVCVYAWICVHTHGHACRYLRCTSLSGCRRGFCILTDDQVGQCSPRLSLQSYRTFLNKKLTGVVEVRHKARTVQIKQEETI